MRFLIALSLLPALLPAASEEVDFSRDVRPILNANCTSCHGGVKMNGDVSFLYREQVLAKGKSGKPTAVPGDPGASEMMIRILSPDPDEVMPPPDHGKPLSSEEADLIRRWIKQGAQWSNHWSFEKPTRHEAPGVSDPTWVKTPIDPFILAKLDQLEIKPGKPAAPGRLLRRISVDLTGFPPSLEDLDAFEISYRENPDTAVAKVIDDLLARDSFGEKWASQWLDVARYADSEGLGADRAWTAWPYRDWVIRALNADMPYNDFLIKQLAGDKLPNHSLDDLIATNFHRLTQQNQEGGTDNEEFRTMAVMDRVNTTWKGIQGVSFECIQCHDHPYDPIKHEEYYRFLAFFDNSRDLDMASHYPVLRVPDKREDFEKVNNLRNHYLQLQTELQDQAREIISATQWQKINKMEVKSERVDSIAKESGGYLEFLTKGTIPRNVVFKLAIPRPENLNQLTAFRVHTLPLDLEKAKHSGTPGAVLSRILLKATLPGQDKTVDIPLQKVIGDDDFSYWDPNKSLSKGADGWGAYTHQYHERSCVVVLKEPLQLPEGTTLHLELHHNANSPTSPMTTKRGRIDFTDNPAFQNWLNEDATRKTSAERDAAKKNYDQLGRHKLAIMEDLPANLERDTRLFLKGNWLDKDVKPLTPGTPASLHKLDSENPGRLELAKWIASPENPFTSRVLVARVWEQLFGNSLVITLEDLGSAGVPPSHPDLLDDLAVRFQTEMNYSVKTLIREILTSATYRQSSEQTSLSKEKDPQNTYLSRGPRNRLRAEVVRDHHLAASGLLNDTLFGPPVRPPLPDGVWKPFSDGPWNEAPVGNPNRYRRSIYTYWKRSIPFPGFDAFDAPTREVCSSRRLPSNTPLAALATLNDKAFAEMADGLARRMKYGTEGDLATRLTAGFRMATSVHPTPRQLEIITKLFHEIEKRYQEDAKQFEGLAGTSDGTAFVVVAGTLLNMDDALTK
ncbi:PSD1 and planctomycete cytochrome C domain-containing protein [Verrucomicrobiaceae bacterium 227]